MERRNRYTVLGDESEVPAIHIGTATLDLPDPEVVEDRRATVVVNCRAAVVHPVVSDKSVEHVVEPPSYTVAVELPTYEEYEKSKEEEEAAQEQTRAAAPPTLISDESSRKMESVIGTDGMFVLGFIFAFIFNWLGLLLAFCMMHTCAGRFGALSGFGLSIVKWVAIVRRNNWTAGFTEEDSWIWWLLITFGVLISCSGSLQYIRIKYLWSRMRGGYSF
jgi:hypothetical protein